MEGLLAMLLGIFPVNPLITVDVKVDVDVNIPGVERADEYFEESSLDALFMK